MNRQKYLVFIALIAAFGPLTIEAADLILTLPEAEAKSSH
jgi:hypothetical protein